MMHRLTTTLNAAAVLIFLGGLLTLIGCGPAGQDGTNSGTAAAASNGKAHPLKICVSSTDVRELVKAVGGDAVQVTGFVNGRDDPHTVNTTPAMVSALAEADLLVVVGLGLEQAWLPPLQEQAGNAAVMAGGEGYLDLSSNLRTIVGPAGQGVPGSYHPEDNPHYLADPVEGVKAAQAIADKLGTVRPSLASQFEANFQKFADAIMVELLGAHVAEKIAPDRLEELAIAIETDRFDAFPHLAEDPSVLQGLLGEFRPYAGTPAVGDHDLWPYFARRYGIRVIDYLEPEPGVAPTTPHLQSVIQKMNDSDCRIILSVQYFDRRHAAFVAGETDATIVPMANQPGGRPGTDSYLDFVRYNAQQLLEALRAKADAATNPAKPNTAAHDHAEQH